MNSAPDVKSQLPEIAGSMGKVTLISIATGALQVVGAQGRLVGIRIKFVLGALLLRVALLKF